MVNHNNNPGRQMVNGRSKETILRIVDKESESFKAVETTTIKMSTIRSETQFHGFNYALKPMIRPRA